MDYHALAQRMLENEAFRQQIAPRDARNANARIELLALALLQQHRAPQPQPSATPTVVGPPILQHGGMRGLDSLARPSAPPLLTGAEVPYIALLRTAGLTPALPGLAGHGGAESELFPRSFLQATPAPPPAYAPFHFVGPHHAGLDDGLSPLPGLIAARPFPLSTPEPIPSLDQPPPPPHQPLAQLAAAEQQQQIMMMMMMMAEPAEDDGSNIDEGPGELAQRMGLRWNERTPCSKCARTFSSRYHAQKHFMRVHYKGKKRHVCTRCHRKAFAVKEDLTTHQKACGRVYLCACGLRLGSRPTLVRHCALRSHEPVSLHGFDADDVPAPPPLAGASTSGSWADGAAELPVAAGSSLLGVAGSAAQPELAHHPVTAPPLLPMPSASFFSADAPLMPMAQAPPAGHARSGLAAQHADRHGDALQSHCFDGSMHAAPGLGIVEELAAILSTTK